MLVRLCPLILAAAVLSAAPAARLAADDEESRRRLLAAYRAWQQETRELEARFNGSVSITGSSLGEISKVDFILGQSNEFPRRYLHHHDHDLVYSAVKGQSDAELEDNLYAICNYVRLAVAARMFNWKARQAPPLIGERVGLERVREIAKQVQAFRVDQVDRIDSGAARPSRVLTAANLGDLGTTQLFFELRQAYWAGQHQFNRQRNSVVFVLFGFELLLSFGIAMVFLRRPRPPVVLARCRG